MEKQSQEAAVARLVAWLPSVQGLQPEARARAQELFLKHQIDEAFLDFIFSDSGVHLMEAYHLRGTADDCSSVPPNGDNRSESSGAGEVAAQVSADSQKPKLCGRQKITMQERQSEGHYFSRAPLISALCLESKSTTPTRVPSSSSTSASANKMPLLETTDRSATAPVQETQSKVVATPPRSASSGSPQESASSLNHQQDLEVIGVLKSFNAVTGYGFISSTQVPGDIFLQGSQLPDGLSPEVGRRIRCTLAHNAKGRPQARNIVWLAPAEPAEVLAIRTASSAYMGKLKSMGGAYGFIECPETHEQYNADVYVKRSQLGEGFFLTQTVFFDVFVDSAGRPQAKRVRMGDVPASASTPLDIERHIPSSPPRAPSSPPLHAMAPSQDHFGSRAVHGAGGYATDQSFSSYTCSTSTEGTISTLDHMRPAVKASRW